MEGSSSSFSSQNNSAEQNKAELDRLKDENDILQCQLNQCRSNNAYLLFEMEEAKKIVNQRFLFQLQIFQIAVAKTVAHIKECEKDKAELEELRAYKRNMEKNQGCKSPQKTGESDGRIGMKTKKTRKSDGRIGMKTNESDGGIGMKTDESNGGIGMKTDESDDCIGMNTDESDDGIGMKM